MVRGTVMIIVFQIQNYEIVDPECRASYFSSNYNSIIEGPECVNPMQEIMAGELASSKVSIVDSQTRCIHVLGAVKKSNGKQRPITNCRPFRYMIYIFCFFLD